MNEDNWGGIIVLIVTVIFGSLLVVAAITSNTEKRDRSIYQRGVEAGCAAIVLEHDLDTGACRALGERLAELYPKDHVLDIIGGINE